MAKGPAPKPKHQLVSWRADTREEIGELITEAPTPYEWMTDRAKSIFHDVCGFAIKMGTLAVSDKSVIARYSVILDRWLTAEENIAKSGISYVEVLDKNGDIRFCRPTKWQAQSDHCVEQLRPLETVLGLTPGDRNRLGMGAVKIDADPLAKYLPIEPGS